MFCEIASGARLAKGGLPGSPSEHGDLISADNLNRPDANSRGPSLQPQGAGKAGSIEAVSEQVPLGETAWRAENGETENYVYSIALQSDT